MLHDGDHGQMFNRIKRFSEIQLKKNHLLSGALALVNVLESPCQASNHE
jgi:hypothetical protein